jgi:arylsulfatase A-like enzyme
METPTRAGTGDASGSTTASDTPRPQRIILISLDTVGARNVGGYSDGRTPNLEKIAKDGVRFDRFYSASTYTLPSHMSMLTGLDAIEHGVVNMPSRLAPDVPTLATELRKSGYETKAIVEGGFVDENFGFDQGFSEFTRLKHKKGLVKTSIWGVLDWMRSKEKTPYFLFLHTYAAHAPYGGFDDFRNRHPKLDLPDEEEIARLKAQYNREEHYPAPRNIPVELRFMCTFYNMNSPEKGDWIGCGDQVFKEDFLESQHFEVYRAGLLEAHREGIRLGDRMIGQVRDTLIELGQLDDTLLIVTSDHGEGMFEHSIHGHGYLPHDEVVKVPLFLSYPRRISGGQVVRGLSWHLDLFPTILSLARIPFDADLLGEDLTRVILNEETINPDRAIHPVLLRPTNRAPLPMRRMTLKGDHKFIEGHRLYGDPEGLLFDLKESPDEDENLRRSRPEIFRELRDLGHDYEGSLTPGEPIHRETGEPISPFPGEVEPFELSEELTRALTELGYIIDGAPPAEHTP